MKPVRTTLTTYPMMACNSKLRLARALTSRWPSRALRRSVATHGAATDAFSALEHDMWQRGASAYDAGFGPLTSQAAPATLTMVSRVAARTSAPSARSVAPPFTTPATAPTHLAHVASNALQ